MGWKLPGKEKDFQNVLVANGKSLERGMAKSDRVGVINKPKEYALYKGEELLATGTKREIAKQLGVSPSTVGYYGTPVYARRTSENGRRLVEI